MAGTGGAHYSAASMDVLVLDSFVISGARSWPFEEREAPRSCPSKYSTANWWSSTSPPGERQGQAPSLSNTSERWRQPVNLMR
jgi:hypothetical protein